MFGIEVLASEVSSALWSALAACGLDEDAAHGLGRGCEEVTAAVPARQVGGTDQSEVGFVDQGGRLEGVVGRLGRHSRCGKLTQFVVDEGEQVGSSPAI